MEADNLEASGGGSQLRLLSLYASNFKKLKFKHPLVFPDGIVLITGLNESGKSTILDAILYALYGRMIRPSQKPSDEEIISYGSGEAQVRLEFAIGETKYRVVRDIHKTRPNTAKLYEVKTDGALKTIATKVDDTTKEVERLLAGITYNEIVASSVVAQKDLERLIKQRLDDRRKVVNVFLNLESFNRVQDSLNEERVRLEGTARTPGLLTIEQQTLETLTERQKEFENQQGQLVALGEKTDKLRLELADLEKRFEEADKLYKLVNEYEDALDRQESLRTEITGKTELENSLKQQLVKTSQTRTELEQAQTDLRRYEGLDDVEPFLTRATSHLETVNESELLLAQLLERERQLRADIDSKKKDFSISEKPATPGKASSSRVWAYLTATGALGAGAILSFFLPFLPAVVTLGSLAVVGIILLAREIASLSRKAEVSEESQKAHANRELVRSWENELSEIRQKTQDRKSRLLQESQETIETLRSMPKYSRLATEGESAKDAVGKALALFESDKQSRSIIEEKSRLLERQLQEEPEIRKKLQTIRDEIANLADKLSSMRLPDLPDSMVFSEDLLADAENTRDSLNKSVSRVRTQIEEAIARQLEVRQFLEENKNIGERLETQQRKVTLLEKDRTVVKYSITGLEQTSESLRNRVKPQVERYMGMILPVITSGHYKAVELDDNYTVKVFDPDAGEFKPKEVFSGGTEDQMLLAMRLAFALALIPQAKGQSPEFLFLDEPLGSSDRVRRAGILSLIQNELSQNFKQIFLISHVGDLEAEADAIIEMENGTVRETVSRKPSIPHPIELAA